MHSSDDKEAEALRIAELIARYLQGTITDKDHDELDRWVGGSDMNMQLFEQLTDEQHITRGLSELRRTDWKKGLEIAQKLKAGKFRKFLFKTTMVAACLVIAAGSGIWFIFNSPDNKTKLSQTTAFERPPGRSVAMLTMNDGKTIVLDSSGDGLLASEGAALIHKKEGTLIYSGNEKEALYNTLSTPRGGMYALTLSDGTRAWLNAESSIRYPAAFQKHERAVEITGEVYLEVAHEPQRPFRVMLQGAAGVAQPLIQVLGTRLNVEAYAGEDIVVSLLEGSLRIHKGQSNQLLKPGERGRIDSESQAIIVTETDVEESIAWKDGLFVFSGIRADEMIRRLSRWYDVPMELRQPASHHFYATVPRSLPLSKVIELLEGTGHVDFSIHEEKIIVK